MTANTSRQIEANVNALMGLAGWSQVQLSKHTGIAQATISRKLRGLADWSVTDLDRLSTALSVSVPELVGTIPTADEWDRRRQPIGAAVGPRFLVLPETMAYDGTAPLPRALNGFETKATSDIMSCTSLRIASDDSLRTA